VLRTSGQLEAITWRVDRNLRYGAQGGNVFRTLVARTQLSVNHAGAVSDEGDRQILVAHVDLDLFEHANGHERGKAVDDRAEARFRKPCCYADHVLLGNAAIQILVRAGFPEWIEEGVAMVTGEQKYLGVFLRGSHKGVRKCVSHALPPSSATAASYVLGLSRV
jgi:hypothetical protein